MLYHRKEDPIIHGAGQKSVKSFCSMLYFTLNYTESIRPTSDTTNGQYWQLTTSPD